MYDVLILTQISYAWMNKVHLLTYYDACNKIASDVFIASLLSSSGEMTGPLASDSSQIFTFKKTVSPSRTDRGAAYYCKD